MFHTLSALASVANLHFDQTTRMNYLLEAQNIAQDLWGADHVNSQSIRNGLASSYHMQGRLEEAHDMFYDLYQTRLRTLGQDDVATIQSTIQMGIIHDWLGNYEESREYSQMCLEVATRVLGERSTLTLKCMAKPRFIVGNHGRV